MPLTRTLAEPPSRVCWQVSRVVTRSIYRRAFRTIGDRTSLGQRCVVLGGVPRQTVVGVPARPCGG